MEAVGAALALVWTRFSGRTVRLRRSSWMGCQTQPRPRLSGSVKRLKGRVCNIGLHWYFGDNLTWTRWQQITCLDYFPDTTQLAHLPMQVSRTKDRPTANSALPPARRAVDLADSPTIRTASTPRALRARRRSRLRWCRVGYGRRWCSRPTCTCQGSP